MRLIGLRADVELESDFFHTLTFAIIFNTSFWRGVSLDKNARGVSRRLELARPSETERYESPRAMS